MKYTIKQILELTRTSLGRRQIVNGLGYWGFPLVGAAAALYRRTVLRNTQVVVVVGSFGKTTTVRALHASLRGYPDVEVGSNAWLRLATKLLSTRPTDCYAIFEVGIDGPGQMKRYAAILRPDYVVVTSVGSEHHRSLGSLDRTRGEKAEMVRALGPSQTAFLNGDDENVRWMRSQTRARVVTFGVLPSNDVVAEKIVLDWPRGTRLQVRTGGQCHELSVRLIGEKTMYSVLAAFAVAEAARLPTDAVIRTLAELVPTPGRLEPVSISGGTYLLRDDYKASLETVDAALDTLEAIPAARKWIVMGEISEPPGSQGPIYRRIGERMGRIATGVIVVGANYQRFTAGWVRSGQSRDAIVDAGRSYAQATELLLERLAPGDVALIKGRDTQKLDRITLLLRNWRVGCDLEFCQVKVRCAHCPMRETGWQGKPPVF